jgi:hypothetical protein
MPTIQSHFQLKESINIVLSIKSISERNVDNETTTIGSRVNNSRFPPRERRTEEDGNMR